MDAIVKTHLLVVGNKKTLSGDSLNELLAEGFDITYTQRWNTIRKQTQNTAWQNYVILVDGDNTSTSLAEMVMSIRKEAQTNVLLIFTSRFRMNALAHALQAGFDEFLAKPVSKDAICALLNRINIETT